MYIESIRLNNFRNYESLEMNFDQGTNILYGDNAQGKTNILEALYLAGTTKSHRGSKDREIIRHDPHKLIEGALIASFAMKAHACSAV